MKTIKKYSLMISSLAVLLIILLMSGCDSTNSLEEINQKAYTEDFAHMKAILRAVDSLHMIDLPLLIANEKADSVDTGIPREAEYYYQSIHQESKYWISVANPQNRSNLNEMNSYKRFEQYVLYYAGLFQPSSRREKLLSLFTMEDEVTSDEKKSKNWRRISVSLNVDGVIAEMNGFRLTGTSLVEQIFPDELKNLDNPESVVHPKAWKKYGKMITKISICLDEATDGDSRNKVLKRKFKRAIRKIRKFDKILPEASEHDYPLSDEILNFHTEVARWNKVKIKISDK